MIGLRSAVTAKLALAVAGALAITSAAVALNGGDLPGAASERAVLAVAQAGETSADEPEGAEFQQDENGTGPNEDASPTAHAVWDVISNWQGEHGCEFGMAVAGAASGASGEEGPEGDPCSRGEEGRARGAAAGAAGQERAEQDRLTGQERADQGPENGEELGQQNHPAGPAEPETSQAEGDDGRQIAEERAARGESDRP